MIIKNVHGSSKVSAKPKHFTSWLRFWEHHQGQTLKEGILYTCPGCGKQFTRAHFDGCHVQKAYSQDQKWYIVPLCDSCNQAIGTLDIGNVSMISVADNNI